MDITSMQMVSTATKPGFNQKPYNHNTKNNYRAGISCRAGNLAMQRGKANFYEVLSLAYAENVCLSDIKKAYRRMVLRYHPDVCPPSAKEESTKRFLELQMAYETLSDPVSREMYDCELGLGFMEEEEDRESRFPRNVWEKQLDGLKKRGQMGASTEGGEPKLPNGTEAKKNEKHEETTAQNTTSEPSDKKRNKEPRDLPEKTVTCELTSWIESWEQCDVLTAAAVIGTVPTVAVAYSYYRRSG
ncbi:chaperone protein DnaJ-like [Hibiscus syriacus]|uniref:chaperone protein DnaJ-like n=1 Tax=Hibiscus syriacus TaxID=106335 RepID=UPI001922EAC9|nr:chaperone protein DnaJ-like [Hibiscus syriacus]